jgi:hypothetical protein
MDAKPLNSESRAAMEEQFQRGAACKDCGGLHKRECPRVKRKQFLGNGNVTEVEYWPDGGYDASNIIWPEDLYDEETNG